MKGMEVFHVTKTDNIWIYGYGKRGNDLYELLSRRSYRIVGFIDRNAERINHDGSVRMVISPDEGLVNIKNDIVIISLMNGMEHDQTARMLYRYGIEKIIYSPMQIATNYDDRRRMRHIFSETLEGRLQEITDIPRFTIDENQYPLVRIIANRERFVSAWWPVDAFCFDSKTEMIIEAYIDFQRFLNGDATDIEPYFKYVGDVGNREKWILSRKKLFALYKDALRYDTSFFTDAPSPCSFFDQKLVMIEGVTRATFLMWSGYHEIPIIALKNDFERAYNKLEENT